MENFRGSNYSWGLVAKIFHWTLAVFILSQISFGINLHFTDPSRVKGELIHFHKIFGTIILFLVFLRLAWKFYNPSPSHESLSFFHKISSKIIQILMYIFLILIPIQGML